MLKLYVGSGEILNKKSFADHNVTGPKINEMQNTRG